MNDDINKTQTDQDSIGQTLDADVAEDQAGYHVHDLDDKGTSEEDVMATDPDHFADDVLENRKDMSQAFDDSGDPDDTLTTNAGGVYDENDVFDEDGEPKNAGTVGIPGADDDTA